ncbi:PH domain-containing protein [Naumannella halotolerans]|uniref:PH domain-containing protein n=1 Tax=Naumannella halotolerans TaxID=993414 RepID=UPI00370DA5DD
MSFGDQEPRRAASEPEPRATDPAAAAPTATPEPALAKRAERPHPATPLIRGWLVLLLVIVAIGREFIPDGSRSTDSASVLELLRANLLIALAALAGVIAVVALSSFISWWFTRYVIDDDELRVETGLFTKSSKRIPFGRIQSIDVIQPLAARIFGLAELRIDAGNDKTSLRYLTRRKTYRIRDYLLSRAHGEQITVADSAAGPVSGGFQDLSARDQVLVRIPPARLLAGLLTATDFLVMAAITLAALITVLALGFGVASVSVLIPIVIGTVRMIGSRVLSQFNYTLSRTGRGLRISRGLTNITSQSVPIDRIQGVRITQYLLWRAFGFYRLDIDVLGIKGTDSSTEDGTQSSSILLPVGNFHDLQVALAQILPGVNLASIPMWGSPSRARLFHWFTIQTFRFGHDDEVAVSVRGLVDRVTDVVPHAKVQSVRITQGPLQRGVRTASVHFDTTPGPVTWTAHELDPQAARALALSQLDRSRRARERVARERSHTGAVGHGTGDLPPDLPPPLRS